MKYIAASMVLFVGLAASLVVAFNSGAKVKSSIVAKPDGVTTVYIQNFATRYISDAEIKNDIPAWEHAANKDFAPVWGTPQVHIVFIGRHDPPKGSLVAVFKSKGPISGALAFHEVERGLSKMVVYSGTSKYYGYDQSVDFTHELFETLADRTTSVFNQGWPAHYYYLDHIEYRMIRNSVWLQEVCDPVEKYAYEVPGRNGKPVKISDFITQNWFNDQIDGGFDFMGIVQQPYTIAKDGYAIFMVKGQWYAITNFSHRPDAAGYLKGENITGRHNS